MSSTMQLVVYFYHLFQIISFFVSDGIIESPNYPENYPNNYDEVCKYSVSQINESFAGVAFGGP